MNHIALIWHLIDSLNEVGTSQNLSIVTALNARMLYYLITCRLLLTHGRKRKLSHPRAPAYFMLRLNSCNSSMSFLFISIISCVVDSQSLFITSGVMLLLYPHRHINIAVCPSDQTLLPFMLSSGMKYLLTSSGLKLKGDEQDSVSLLPNCIFLRSSQHISSSHYPNSAQLCRWQHMI